MSDPVSRRTLIRSAIAAGASFGLGAAIVKSNGDMPRNGFLGTMERWNERFQRLLFDPNRLAPELGPEELTKDGAFPSYHIDDGIPLAPAGWVLEVALDGGDRVALEGRVRTPALPGPSDLVVWYVDAPRLITLDGEHGTLTSDEPRARMTCTALGEGRDARARWRGGREAWLSLDAGRICGSQSQS